MIDNTTLLYYGVFAAIMGVVCAVIWRARGGQAAAGALAGVAGGIFGLLYVLLAKTGRLACPWCKGAIRADALICPHCQRNLTSPQPPQLPPGPPPMM